MSLIAFQVATITVEMLQYAAMYRRSQEWPTIEAGAMFLLKYSVEVHGSCLYSRLFLG